MADAPPNIIAIVPGGAGVANFAPSSHVADIGDDVYWRNDDVQPHWPAPVPAAGQPVDRTAWLEYQIPGVVAGAENAVSDGISFDTAGTYRYLCCNHHGERGEIVIAVPGS